MSRDFYGLDVDLSTTELAENPSDVKVFVEIADQAQGLTPPLGSVVNELPFTQPEAPAAPEPPPPPSADPDWPFTEAFSNTAPPPADLTAWINSPFTSALAPEPPAPPTPPVTPPPRPDTDWAFTQPYVAPVSTTMTQHSLAWDYLPAPGAGTGAGAISDGISGFFSVVRRGNNGGWQDSRGWGQSQGTGPSDNSPYSDQSSDPTPHNPFMVTQTSGGSFPTPTNPADDDGLTAVSTNGRVNLDGTMLAGFLAGTSRRITIRVCAQGLFSDNAQEGLALWAETNGDGDAVLRSVMRGWANQDSGTEREQGDTVTDYGGTAFTVAVDGGWRDFTFTLDDSWTDIFLQPNLFGPASVHMHDIAIKSMTFEWLGTGGPPPPTPTTDVRFRIENRPYYDLVASPTNANNYQLWWVRNVAGTPASHMNSNLILRGGTGGVTSYVSLMDLQRLSDAPYTGHLRVRLQLSDTAADAGDQTGQDFDSSIESRIRIVYRFGTNAIQIALTDTTEPYHMIFAPGSDEYVFFQAYLDAIIAGDAGEMDIAVIDNANQPIIQDPTPAPDPDPEFDSPTDEFVLWRRNGITPSHSGSSAYFVRYSDTNLRYNRRIAVAEDTSGFVTLIELQRNSASNYTLKLHLGSAFDGTGTGAGPDFDNTIEQNLRIAFRHNGQIRSFDMSDDEIEPYVITVDSSDLASELSYLTALYNAIAGGSAQTVDVAVINLANEPPVPTNPTYPAPTNKYVLWRDNTIAPVIDSGVARFVYWNNAALRASTRIAVDTNTSAFVTDLILDRPSASSVRVRLSLGTEPDASGSSHGPEFASAVESNLRVAFKHEAAVVQVSITDDLSEPYGETLTSSDVAYSFLDDLLTRITAGTAANVQASIINNVNRPPLPDPQPNPTFATPTNEYVLWRDNSIDPTFVSNIARFVYWGDSNLRAFKRTRLRANESGFITDILLNRESNGDMQVRIFIGPSPSSGGGGSGDNFDTSIALRVAFRYNNTAIQVPITGMAEPYSQTIDADADPAIHAFLDGLLTAVQNGTEGTVSVAIINHDNEPPISSAIDDTNIPTQQAEERLLEIPSVVASARFGIGFNNFNFRLRNDDDKFTGVDYIGHDCRLWAIDHVARHIIATGRITSQSISLVAATFTVSSIPIKELSTHFPTRKIDPDVFPYAKNLAETDVPVIIGHASRVPLILIGDGVSTRISADVATGATTIVLDSVAGIGPGDRLVLDLDRPNSEIVTVQSIDSATRTLTLSASITQAHTTGETASSLDNQGDYLIGEGVGAQGNFQEVENVYNGGRLIEAITADVATTSTYVAGQINYLQLPEDIRVPVEGWYIGFFIVFQEDGTKTSVVENYFTEQTTLDDGTIVEEHSISFTPLTDITPVSGSLNVSLSNYRFYDGSQTLPYPGYAFIRFTTLVSTDVYADCIGFQHETNPAEFLRSVMTNANWGIGATINAVSFNVAAALVSDMLFEGAVTSRVTVEALIEEVAQFRELIISRDRQGIRLDFAQAKAPAATLPDQLEHYQTPAPTIGFNPLDATPTKITLRYRQGQTSDEWAGELTADVGTLTDGEELSIDLPFVHDSDTADRILYYRERLEALRRKFLRVVTDLLLARGDVVRLPALAPFTNAETLWEVLEVEEVGDVSNTATLAPYDASVYTYDTSRTVPDAIERRFVVDYSQTHPGPIRNLELSTCYVESEGRFNIYIDADWDPPIEEDNYAGAIVSYGNVAGQDIVLGRNLRPNPKVRIPVDLAATRYTISIRSQSPHNDLEGYPVSMDITSAGSSEDFLALPTPSALNPSRIRSSTISRWLIEFDIHIGSGYVQPGDFRGVQVIANYAIDGGSVVSQRFPSASTYYSISQLENTVENLRISRSFDHDDLSVVVTPVLETSNTSDDVAVQELDPFTLTRPNWATTSPSSYFPPSNGINATLTSLTLSGGVWRAVFRVEFQSSTSGWTPPSTWAGFRVEITTRFGNFNNPFSTEPAGQGFTIQETEPSSGYYNTGSFPRSFTITKSTSATTVYNDNVYVRLWTYHTSEARYSAATFTENVFVPTVHS